MRSRQVTDENGCARGGWVAQAKGLCGELYHTSCSKHIRLIRGDRQGGISVLLPPVSGGKVPWVKGFGLKNAETGGTVTDETIFEAASLSKPRLNFGF
jgi:hypothetical protein